MKNDPLINRARGGAAQVLRSLAALPRERRLVALNDQLAQIDRSGPERLSVEIRVLMRQGYDAETAVKEALARVLADILIAGRPAPMAGLGQTDPGAAVSEVLRGIACAPGVTSLVAGAATRGAPGLAPTIESGWASVTGASGACVGVTPPPPTPPPPLPPSSQSGADVFTPVVVSLCILAVAGVAAFALNPR